MLSDDGIAPPTKGRHFQALKDLRFFATPSDVKVTEPNGNIRIEEPTYWEYRNMAQSLREKRNNGRTSLD